MAQLRAWLRSVRPRTLNVAGPRASADPAIGAATEALLRAGLDAPEALDRVEQLSASA